MNRLKSLGLAIFAAAAIAAGARVAHAFLGGLVVNGSFAVSQVVPIPLGQGVNSLGATVSYSSPSFSNATFSTGQTSAGSVTVASNALLLSAAATENIVVKSTSGAFGDSVSMSCPIGRGATVVRVPYDWNYGANTTAAAASLAAALTRNGSCLGGVQFASSFNVVYATAPKGSLYNSITVFASNAATLSASASTFTGGRDNAVVSVNGRPFMAGVQFAVGGSASATAGNLATAISGVSSLPVTVSVASNVLNLSSSRSNSAYNFPLATSNPAAISVSGPSMVGGLTPSWALNATTISIPNHGFVTGLPLLYTAAGPTLAISGLTDQTTYYAGVVDANDLALATSRSNAAAGTYITLGSSVTVAASAVYTLSALPFSAGSAGFNWVVSNDAQTWSQLAISSVTYTSPGSTVYSFGAIPFKFLGLNTTAPNQGALTLQVNAQGN